MAMKGGMPGNLTPGNPGNRGGGQSIKVRETKQAWLDSILNADAREHGAEGTVNDALKAKLIHEALHGNGHIATWIKEMAFGKPNSKTEVVLNNGEIVKQVAQAMYQAGCTEEQAKAVMQILYTSLMADPG